MIVPFTCSHCGRAVQSEADPDTKTASCPECSTAAEVELTIVPGVVIGNGYRIDEKVGEGSAS